MSRHKRYEIGCHNGVDFSLVYDQNYNQGGWEPALAWSWFLFIDGDFRGIFERKKDAMQDLENETGI